MNIFPGFHLISEHSPLKEMIRQMPRNPYFSNIIHTMLRLVDILGLEQILGLFVTLRLFAIFRYFILVRPYCDYNSFSLQEESLDCLYALKLDEFFETHLLNSRNIRFTADRSRNSPSAFPTGHSDSFRSH